MDGKSPSRNARGEGRGRERRRPKLPRARYGRPGLAQRDRHCAPAAASMGPVHRRSEVGVGPARRAGEGGGAIRHDLVASRDGDGDGMCANSGLLGGGPQPSTVHDSGRVSPAAHVDETGSKGCTVLVYTKYRRYVRMYVQDCTETDESIAETKKRHSANAQEQQRERGVKRRPAANTNNWKNISK